MIISSERKICQGCLDDTFPAYKFYINSAGVLNITLTALIILTGYLSCFRSFLHNMLCLKVGETAAESQ